VAGVCHEFGVPLIVDEAWGAHLPFHPELPTWGMDADADMVIASVHKMGGAIEQSSVFHVKGDRVSAEVLEQREDLLGTTSSSSLVYATLDGWRRQMVEQGHDLLGTALARSRRIREAVTDVPGLSVMGEEIVREGPAFEHDPLKLSIDVRELGITGMQAAEWLRDNCHVDVGSADTVRICPQITHGDDDRTEALLVESLRRLAKDAESMERPPRVALPASGVLELEQAIRPRDAFFGAVEHVPAARAAGRVAAETITPYPPGVPAVAPGEVITQEIVEYLTSGVAAGMLLPDAADQKLETFRVVA
jgi:arginine/lysine/ornithine decarboxylase